VVIEIQHFYYEFQCFKEKELPERRRIQKLVVVLIVVVALGPFLWVSIAFPFSINVAKTTFSPLPCFCLVI